MRKPILIVFMLLFVLVMPVVGQEDVSIVEPSALEAFGDFVIEADLIQWAIMLVMVFFLGTSVPQSAIDQGRISASQTKTPIDDLLWEFLDGINRKDEGSGTADSTGSEEDAKPEETAEDGESSVVPGKFQTEIADKSSQ